MSTPITITQLLKDPHSIQKMVAQGQNLDVFSRSKLVFEIHPPSRGQNKQQTKKFKIPTISFPIKGSLNRSEMYSDNSWLDSNEADKKDNN